MKEPEKKGNTWIYEDGKTKIVIDRKWCKGCAICVEFCPKKVLVMNRDKAVVAELDKCSRCLLCELRCPDFAIEVFDLGKEKKESESKEE